MTLESNTTMEHMHTASLKAQPQSLRSSALKVGRFFLHLLEMTLAMMVGMIALYILDEQIPITSSYKALLRYGTNGFDLAMGIFMTLPMVAWMILRRHGWRHSLEMAAAMGAPVAGIILLRSLGGEAYLRWLDDASHPAMFVTMFLAMLYRRGHYTGNAGHSAHAAHTHAQHTS